MRESLIIGAAVFAAIAALMVFVVGDSVTRIQMRLANKGFSPAEALSRARHKKQMLRIIWIVIPAFLAVVFNICAAVMRPAEPPACVNRPTETSTPVATPSGITK